MMCQVSMRYFEWQWRTVFCLHSIILSLHSLNWPELWFFCSIYSNKSSCSICTIYSTSSLFSWFSRDSILDSILHSPFLIARFSQVSSFENRVLILDSKEKCQLTFERYCIKAALTERLLCACSYLQGEWW